VDHLADDFLQTLTRNGTDVDALPLSLGEQCGTRIASSKARRSAVTRSAGSPGLTVTARATAVSDE
jgi:hypothetical protein